MKKYLLTFFCALTAFCAMAQGERNYTEQYVPSVNGEAQDPENVNVTVADNGNGTVNVTFRDFVLHVYGQDVPISKVDFLDVPTTTDEEGLTHFSKEGTFTPEIPEEFRNITVSGISVDLTEYVKNLPYTIEGKLNDNRFYAVLDFDVKVKVLFITVVDDHYSFEIGSENLTDSKIYEELLLVTVNGETSEPQTTYVVVDDNGNGTINFELRNFMLSSDDSELPVGTIRIENIAVTEDADGMKSFTYNEPITIQAGDKEGVDTWYGPMLGQIPISLSGKLNNEHLFATIDIEMTSLEQTIHVQLGSDMTGTVETRNYTEPIAVSINGESSATQTSNVVVNDKGNGTFDFVLNDFSLNLGLTQLPLGDFTISGIPCLTGEDGLTYFSHNGTFSIPADELPEQYKVVSDLFTNIPVEIEGKMNDEKFYGVITWTVPVLNQPVCFVIGTDIFGGDVDETTKVYTEPLVVSVNGDTSETQTTDVTITKNEDGTVNFLLKNFTLVSMMQSMPIGTIYLENIPVTEGEDEWQHFAYSGTTTLLAGDQEGVNSWVGPSLGEIPIVLEGRMNGERLDATIDLEMTSFNQTIHLKIGEFKSAIIDEDGNRVYTEQLVVTVNGTASDPQTAKVVVVENNDGTINFILKNFFLVSEESSMPVGTIVVENIETKMLGGVRTFAYNGPITIQPGDKEGVEEWYGPQLGEIPVDLSGKLDDDHLFATIDINLALFLQVVHVEIGTDDFPGSIVPKTYTEPFYVTVADATVGPETAVVNIYDKGDKVDFELKDFVLDFGNISIPFGNLVLTDLDATEGNDGMKHFSGDRSVSIALSDLPEIVQQAISLAGGLDLTVPITIEGRFDDNTLFADFDAKVSIPVVGEYSAHVQIVGGIKGDLNGDNQVSIADAVSVLEAMAQDSKDPKYDLNNDGTVSIADFVAVLEIMAQR